MAGRASGRAKRVEEAGVLCRELGPLLGHVVFVEDRFHRADRLAGAAFHALIGVGIEHPLALVDAVDRALIGAGLILDIKHGSAITYVMAGSTSRRPAGTGVRPGLPDPRGFLAADVRHLHFLLRACCE
jgi:hypothetical protein